VSGLIILNKLYSFSTRSRLLSSMLS